jgi:DNA-binding transcriptional LysR family regulator
VKAFIDFLDKHSKNSFKLLLREKTTTQIIEDVFTLQSNLGIIIISDSTKRFMQKYLKSKGLEFHQLATVGYHAFIRTGHPLAKQESVTLEELSSFPFVSYEQESYSLNFSEEAIVLNSKQSINVLDRATMNNIICNTNSYNIGTGILMKKIIENDIISIPISDLTDKIDIGWIGNKHSLTKEAKEFIELCKKYI